MMPLTKKYRRLTHVVCYTHRMLFDEVESVLARRDKTILLASIRNRHVARKMGGCSLAYAQLMSMHRRPVVRRMTAA